MASTYQSIAHHDPTQRAMASDYNLDYSTYSYPHQNYPVSFNFPSSSYASSTSSVHGFNAFCSAGAAASLYIPPAYTDPRCMPAIDTSRNLLASSDNSPVVKAEDASPEDGSYGFYNVSPQDLHAPEQPQDAASGTDVDTLMKAIQTKSEKSTPPGPSPVAYQPSIKPCSNPAEQRVRSRGYGFDHGAFKSRKKYQCHIPACGKVFFQKTHLEIHVRAHTGHKPFVSGVDSLRLYNIADRRYLDMQRKIMRAAILSIGQPQGRALTTDATSFRF